MPNVPSPRRRMGSHAGRISAVVAAHCSEMIFDGSLVKSGAGEGLDESVEVFFAAGEDELRQPPISKHMNDSRDGGGLFLVFLLVFFLCEYLYKGGSPGFGSECGYSSRNCKRTAVQRYEFRNYGRPIDMEG